MNRESGIKQKRKFSRELESRTCGLGEAWSSVVTEERSGDRRKNYLAAAAPAASARPSPRVAATRRRGKQSLYPLLAELKADSAEHVLDSGRADFQESLTSLAGELGATWAADVVLSGGAPSPE